MIRWPAATASSAEAIPLRTRSFASWHARSASPTIANDWQPRLEVRLDLDPAWIEADEGVGDGAREHVATLGRNVPTCLCRLRNTYARRATSTSSKYSPARRPVRRLTCRW